MVLTCSFRCVFLCDTLLFRTRIKNNINIFESNKPVIMNFHNNDLNLKQTVFYRNLATVQKWNQSRWMSMNIPTARNGRSCLRKEPCTNTQTLNRISSYIYEITVYWSGHLAVKGTAAFHSSIGLSNAKKPGQILWINFMTALNASLCLRVLEWVKCYENLTLLSR